MALCLVFDDSLETMTNYGLQYGPHLVALSVGYVIFSYASVPAHVGAEFGVGYTAVGLLMSAALFSFVLVQVFGNRLVGDRPTLPVLLGVVCCNAVLAVVLDFAPSYESLLVLRAIWGLSGGLAVTVCAIHISRINEGSRATWHQGINGAMFALGGAISFVVTPQIIAITSWFGVHAVGGLIAVPAIVALWSGWTDADLTRPRVALGSTDTGGSNPRSTPITNPIVLLAAWCYVASLGGYITLSTFVTAYFSDIGVVGPVNALALFVAALGRFGGGVVILRPNLNEGTLIAGTAVVGAVCLLALVIGSGPALVALSLLALAAVSVPFGSILKTAAVASPRDATAVALVVAVGNAAALVLPAVTGWLRDVTGTYDLAFVLLATLNVVAIAAGVAISRLEVERNEERDVTSVED